MEEFLLGPALWEDRLLSKLSRSLMFFLMDCWVFQHPRHGLIPCITAVRDIEEGEELFLHYGYDPRNCPGWYQQLLAHFLSLNPDLELEQAADPKRLVGKYHIRNSKRNIFLGKTGETFLEMFMNHAFWT